MNKIAVLIFITITINLFSQNKNNKKLYKLIAFTDTSYAGCGIYSTAYAFKFIQNKKCVIAIVLCPDLYNKNFFQKNKYYTITPVTDSTRIKRYADVTGNRFEKENLPTIYVDKIKRISKY